MAANQLVSRVTIGTLIGVDGVALSTNAIQATTTRDAWGFQLDTAKTLNNVLIYFTAQTGYVSGDCTLRIETDTAGSPSGVLVTGGTANLTSVSTSAWNTFSGYTASLSANTQYWMVFTPSASVGAGRQFTIAHNRKDSTTASIPTIGLSVKGGLGRTTSSDSGTTYHTGGNDHANITGYRLDFSDSTYFGFPAIYNLTNGDQVYSAREVGIKFTVPASWPTINIRSAGLPITTTGTPATNGRFRIYTGSTTTPTLLATSATISKDNLSDPFNSNPFVASSWTSAQAITAGTTVRVTYGVVTGGDSSNFFRPYVGTVENSAASKALMPLGKYVYTFTTDGTTFTDTDTQTLPFLVELDSNGEFTVSTGGLRGQNTASGGAQ